MIAIGISTSPFLYSRRCHRRIHATKTTSWIRTHKIEKKRTCLKGAHTLVCLRSCLHFKGDDAKMGVPFYTSLYIFTYIKIHSRREKYALNKRNVSQVKIIVKNERLERKARTWEEFWSQHVMFVVNGLRGSSRIIKKEINYSSL